MKEDVEIRNEIGDRVRKMWRVGGGRIVGVMEVRVLREYNL